MPQDCSTWYYSVVQVLVSDGAMVPNFIQSWMGTEWSVPASPPPDEPQATVGSTVPSASPGSAGRSEYRVHMWFLLCLPVCLCGRGPLSFTFADLRVGRGGAHPAARAAAGRDGAGTHGAPALSQPGGRGVAGSRKWYLVVMSPPVVFVSTICSLDWWGHGPSSLFPS
eukprot:scaffold1016_cov132-Isochrysis_galbana.AAC.2